MLDGVFIFREFENRKGLFFVDSLLSPKRIKVYKGELFQPLGKEDFFTVGSPTKFFHHPESISDIIIMFFRYFLFLG